jgi:cardiolipin synthase
MATTNIQKARPPYQKTEAVELIHSGEDFFSTLESLIYSAKHVIHFQTYIYEEDEAGLRIAEALKAAAQRGVKVYMVIDALGSKFSKKFVADLKATGIHFKWFAPFMSREYFHFGRRMHHKVVVADQKIALIGGMNISARYLPSNGNIPWLDYAVLVRGSICTDVEKICCQILKKEFNYYESGSSQEEMLACVRTNDRLRGKNQIAKSYLKEIWKAKKSITILGPYFVPGARISHALIMAARRGVKVRIILSAVSDVPILGHASRFLYRKFLDNNIELYEWNKSILHGKVAVVDDRWATVGSFNLNHLSAFSSIEMNVNVLDRTFAKNLREQLDAVIAEGCEKSTTEAYMKTLTPMQNCRNTFSYFFMRACLKSLAMFPNIFSFTKSPRIEF